MEHNPPKEKARAGEHRANSNKLSSNSSANNSALQRQRLLAALRKRPMSTLEIRRELDILGVAPRVFELKERGYHIITYWRNEPTDSGQLHRVALYALLGESGAV